MQAEIDIYALVAVVWTLISDPARIGTISSECLGGNWDRDDATGGLGTHFNCRNRWAGRGWTTTSAVTQWEPERAFCWIVGDPRNPSATWRYNSIHAKAAAHASSSSWRSVQPRRAPPHALPRYPTKKSS